MVTITGRKEQKWQVQRINIHSDMAEFRQWRTVATNLTKRDAELYHARMKNSDNNTWRAIPV